MIPADILNDVEASRVAFFGWFFGASGGAGIARSAFPRMYSEFQYIRSLKGSQPSQGGDTLRLNPLCGYPEDLSIKDLKKVVNNRMSIEQIVQKFPIENNFLSKKGYITFAAFEMANKGANPLAVRAIFDTFAQSTDVCDPFIAQDKINSYKEDISVIGGALFKSKITGYVAVFALLFLLGLAGTFFEVAPLAMPYPCARVSWLLLFLFQCVFDFLYNLIFSPFDCCFTEYQSLNNRLHRSWSRKRRMVLLLEAVRRNPQYSRLLDLKHGLTSLQG